MDFHQLAAVIELHQLTVGTDIEHVPDPLLGQRVQRFGDLGVEIAVHLHLFEHRHVIDTGHRQQQGLLGGSEHLQRTCTGAAVDAGTGSTRTPHSRGLLRLIETGECFTVPEVSAYILHCPFYPWLIPRRQLCLIR
jgi:hypothetical protein